MDGSGPVLSLQRTGADLYSPRRPEDYAGDLTSHNFPTETHFWEIGKHEETGTGNIGLDSVSPVYESVGNSNSYGYTIGNVAPLQDESGGFPGSVGLGLSYTSLDGYVGSIVDPLTNTQAFPSLYEETSILPASEYQHSSIQPVQGVHLDSDLSYEQLDGNIANNLTPVYDAGVNYNAEQPSTSPNLYSQQYNNADEFVPTTVSHKGSLQVSEIQSRVSSEPWSPHSGDEELVQVQKDISAVVQIPGQSYFIQSGTAWDSSTGSLSALHTTIFNNKTTQFLGSPFQASPLSSLNPSPFIDANPWGDEYSTSFVEVQGDISWQNQLGQQDFSANYTDLPPIVSVPPNTNDQSGSSASKYQDLVSVIQVDVKRESVSPPLTLQPRLDDLIGNFDSNPDCGSRKRKRTKFSAEGAEKVREVRNKGACVSCHYRKTPCSTDDICKHCLKAAKNNPSLAKEICVRDKLQESYVGVKTIFGSLESRKGDLHPLLQSLSGDALDVVISVSSAGVRGGRDAFLPLQVRQCDVDPICRWKGLSKVKGIYITHPDSVYAQRYAIVPGSISAAAVDKFAQQVLPLSGSHSGEITRVLDEFLTFYSTRRGDTPLRKFVKSTLKVAGLNGLVQYGTLDMRDGSYDLLGRPRTEASYVSPTVHDQIRLLAAGVLKDEEKSVFSQIDTFKKLVGPNRHARIIVQYAMLSGFHYQGKNTSTERVWNSLLICIGGSQSPMVYFVAKPIRPLTTPWVAERDDQKNSGMDRDLQALFRNTQNAYSGFCKNLTDEHDTIFKGLVIPVK